MEQLIFEDYIKPSIRYQEEAFTIITLVIKQISRCRFEIASAFCKVIILLNGEKRTVIVSNKIKTDEFRNLAWIASPNEPSLDFLRNELEGVNEVLLTWLIKYQDQFFKLGTEFENEYWYKFYSKTEIKNDMRELYQASWIDYEKQLENELIIHDALGVCGLWAMPYDMLLNCFKEQCKERYGDKLFVLKTVPDCRYLNDDKELIGDRFEVIKNYDLNSIEDVGELFEHLINLEKNKYTNIIDKQNEKISELIDNQRYLNAVINKCKQTRWLFLLIGIICVITILKFM